MKAIYMVMFVALVAGDLAAGESWMAKAVRLEKPLTALDVCVSPVGRTHTYRPQAGDVLLFDVCNWTTRAFFVVGTGNPICHAAIVVEEDGRPLVLSAEKSEGVILEDFYPYLRTCKLGDVVWVRRLNQPLTDEQKIRLACFARQQEGKRYAALGQLLAVPYKVPVVGQVWGALRPENIDQPRWFCTQLVVSAFQAVGIISCQFRPSSFDPGELARMGGFSRPYILCGLTPVPRAN